MAGIRQHSLGKGHDKKFKKRPYSTGLHFIIEAVGSSAMTPAGQNRTCITALRAFLHPITKTILTRQLWITKPVFAYFCNKSFPCRFISSPKTDVYWQILLANPSLPEPEFRRAS